jgi:hypothetical protein
MSSWVVAGMGRILLQHLRLSKSGRARVNVPLALPVSRGVERFHLHCGFVVSGQVALDEVAVSGQRRDLYYGFLLGHPELR